MTKPDLARLHENVETAEEEVAGAQEFFEACKSGGTWAGQPLTPATIPIARQFLEEAVQDLADAKNALARAQP